VMLYGPAGTGKTIMCQAAAYEAKAELIIGAVTTLPDLISHVSV
jgi:ATP-dependent 26S proteasome regulatory subunit